MQKNYYLCKLLCQRVNAYAQHPKNDKTTPLRCFADLVGKVTKIY